MHKVIFDANFLFAQFQFKIDVFDEIESLIGRFEPIVLSTTLEELKRLSMKRSEKVRRQAILALELAGRCKLMEVELKPGERFDNVILRVAKENNCIVATNDRRLRMRLREFGIPTIFVRQKSYLQIEGYV
jgi:rRNA-processing protein FCF1